MRKNRSRFVLPIIVFLIITLSDSSQIQAQENCSGSSIFISNVCKGDEVSATENAIFELVNKYRIASGQSAIKLSPALSMVGNRRMLDLNQNMKSTTHSWSNCRYDINDQKTWPCLTDAPRRLNSGYNGEGYETLYRTTASQVSPDAALEAWKKSSLHSSIILNEGMFQKMVWEEVGVAIDGSFAALWFGYPGRTGKTQTPSVTGLGVSYDQVISGLSRLLSIDQPSSTAKGNLWQGTSTDKKVKLEISGSRNEIADATVVIMAGIDINGKFDPAKKFVLTSILKNIFPEWPDVDMWLDNSLTQIARNPTMWKTKVVRKIQVDLRADATASIKLSIKPQTKPVSIEIY